MTQKKAMITGVSGRIGHYLNLDLIDEGWDVRGLTRQDDIASTVAQFKPQVIFHLATHSILEHNSSDVEPLIQSNIIFGSQVLEAASQLESCSFVNTGSYWEYYDGEGYSPVNLYAATKRSFEKILQYYGQVKDIPFMTLKLFNVYCPQDKGNKIFSLIDEAAKNQCALSMTEGNQIIDWVYITDIVSAYKQAYALLKQHPQILEPSYSLSSINRCTLKEAVELYIDIQQLKVDIKWGDLPYRNREVMNPWRGKRLPGWQAEVGLAEGIKLCKQVEVTQ